MSQLALPLKLADHAVFESFFRSGNESIVAYLEDLVATRKGPGCWIRGATSTGKTHLLQATCERCGDNSLYLPLGEFSGENPAILEGLARRQFVCLDDLQTVAGDEQWELALFELLNQLADEGAVVIVAATSAPRDCGLVLPDLKSRLTRLPTFSLNALDDSARVGALQLRASHRGLVLPDETARYILGRSRRDMATLYRQLDKLDSAALEAQRKLTIPFVRDALNL